MARIPFSKIFIYYNLSNMDAHINFNECKRTVTASAKSMNTSLLGNMELLKNEKRKVAFVFQAVDKLKEDNF